jgi:tRNA (uracil-5-)-methyltransferase TRM9
MSPQTVQKLIQLNKTFYSTVARNTWNSKQDYFWEGWTYLLPYIEEKISDTKTKDFTVLDIGCGNMRFHAFLTFHYPHINFEYTGVDFFQWSENLPQNATYIQTESIHESLGIGDKQFDLVVAFGVLHHIPTQELHLQVLQQMYNSLMDNGVVCITTWQFLRLPRLQKRVLSLEDGNTLLAQLDIDQNEFGEQDYLLNWVKKDYGIRYAHYFSYDEMQNLLTKSGFIVKKSYLQDDRTQNRNEYFVVEKL